MSHGDTSVAITQAITPALYATKGQKRSYQQAITHALNATQGHKHWLSISTWSNLYPILRLALNPILRLALNPGYNYSTL